MTFGGVWTGYDCGMTKMAYRRPPWWLRAVGNRLSPLNTKTVAVLSVPGRHSGRTRRTPVAVLEHDGARYLISPFGDTEWARNLRAVSSGMLSRGRDTERIRVVEVPPERRSPLLAAYRARYGRMPRVDASFRDLPEPRDHPTFRLVAPEESGSASTG
jgi:deazaflavin-dependent oxidoreductase (nitroreductase family)